MTDYERALSGFAATIDRFYEATGGPPPEKEPVSPYPEPDLVPRPEDVAEMIADCFYTAEPTSVIISRWSRMDVRLETSADAPLAVCLNGKRFLVTVTENPA